MTRYTIYIVEQDDLPVDPDLPSLFQQHSLKFALGASAVVTALLGGMIELSSVLATAILLLMTIGIYSFRAIRAVRYVAVGLVVFGLLWGAAYFSPPSPTQHVAAWLAGK